MGSSLKGIATLLMGFALTSCGGAGESQQPTTPPATTQASTTTAPQPEETTTTEAQPTEVAVEVAAGDPCSLLTVADIEEATGIAFVEGTINEALSGDTQVICDWIATAEYATVQTLIIPTDVWATQRASAAEVFTLVDVDIPGADAAYMTEEGSLIGMQVADRFVQVSYIPAGPGEVVAHTTMLATIAAANLMG